MIGKYLFTSTVSVYGGLGHAKQCPTARTGPMPPHLLSAIDMDLCCPMQEEDLDLLNVEDTYDPDLEVYAQGKRQCEKYLLKQPDFNHVSIRVPPVLGPEDPTRRIWYYIQRVLDGKEMILPDGGQNIFRNMFSVDVANALIAAIDSEQTRPGAYNICQGEIMTLKQLIEDIAEAVGKEPNLVSIPSEILETQTDLPYESWRFDPFSRPGKYVMSIEKARRDFNMQWTPQREWVKTTVEWYQTEYSGQDSVHYEQREKEAKIAGQYRKAFEGFMESLGGTF
ncbi:MAG: NAD-dependent epimerase/dehydratase family protein, partial [Candidatus Tectomicrobia bacterium]|nr:NAD-dependent epimerase/dehydratase family protein [Candidatus Tectomicrobia bacterium]